MNVRSRVQVDGVVTGVNRRLVYYPACDSCAGKLTILEDDSKHSGAESITFWCGRCLDAVEEKDLHYRYCLVLTVSDKTSAANVTAFGNGWDKLFGATATNLHKALKKFSAQETHETVNQYLHDSIIAAFVGCRFNFTFNVYLTRTIPQGSLSFKSLNNNITHHGHNYCNNLIATNFTMLEVKQFKTVINVLEAKLFRNDLVGDIKEYPAVQRTHSTLHHDNNSYLYGSWLSDTVSQEMCLVSLKDEHCRSSTQSSLVDSIYWRWDQTSSKVEDEDIISDIVSHLELSKIEFLTLGANCDDNATTAELHTINSDSPSKEDFYSESFLNNFFSSQKSVEEPNSVPVLPATNLAHNEITNTPSRNYSPDLFSTRKCSRLKIAQCKVSTPDSLQLSSLVEKTTSGQDLFEDHSLNSPHLFGQVDRSKSPIKMIGTTDFTSPALC